MGRVGTRLLAALGLLALLIVLAFSLWSSRSEDPVQEERAVESLSPSLRGAGTSTLSHGGPAPAGMTGPSGARRGVEPFRQPALQAPRDASVPWGAEGVTPTERRPRVEDGRPGPGAQGP